MIPLVLLSGLIAILLVSATIHRSHAFSFTLTMAGLAAAAVSCMVPSPDVPLLELDRYARFYMAVLFGSALAVAAMSQRYLERLGADAEEYCLLLLLATLGAAVVASSRHFVTFFVGLETLSVAAYALVAYTLRTRAVEAGLKYLVLAGASSAFLLFGMAVIYGTWGTLDLAGLARSPGPGLALFLVGIAFKLALVPFHMWTPDVYEGAPAPVAALLATVSKGGVFAFVLRHFAGEESAFLPLAFLAIASMTGGNVLALFQGNLKRLLAYSSIAHMGYLTVALLAGGAMATAAGTYYLVTYVVSVLAAFGVVTVLDAERLEDLRGLFWRRPALATLLTASLLSLAGIPLTAGFVGKFYVISAGVESALWVAVIALVVNSVIGLFYYLRVIVAMFRPLEAVESPPVSALAGAALAALFALILLLGVAPSPILEIILTL